MISDKRLREAAQKAEESFLASLPEPEDCEATFSPEFERKMKKLIRRTEHPIRYRLMKAVACFLLVVLVGGGSVLTFSMEARAAFVGWIREVYETWFVYRYNDDVEKTSVDVVYRPTWLPDGYRETFVPEVYGQVYILYEDDLGSIISFAYSNDSSTLTGLLPEDSPDPLEVLVGNCSADFYLDQSDEINNLLVWTNSSNNYIFWISANLPKDDMIKIAESVAELVPN